VLDHELDLAETPIGATDADEVGIGLAVHPALAKFVPRRPRIEARIAAVIAGFFSPRAGAACDTCKERERDRAQQEQSTHRRSEDAHVAVDRPAMRKVKGPRMRHSIVLASQTCEDPNANDEGEFVSTSCGFIVPAQVRRRWASYGWSSPSGSTAPPWPRPTRRMLHFWVLNTRYESTTSPSTSELISGVVAPTPISKS
jgi:hypothetical protein